MKIAHISDLHLNSFFSDSNLESIKHILKYILHANSDHIVITGDLTDNADLNDFEILRNLFKETGILRSDRLTIVVGNHDIFGGPRTPEEIIYFPDRCKDINYEKSINSFTSFFEETFKHSYLITKENKFPFIKEINNIQLIGLNSIDQYSKVNNPFASNGKIKKTELLETSKLLTRLNQNQNLRIALIHHHFNKMKLKNVNLKTGFCQKIERQIIKLRKKKRLLNFFKEQNIELVLHGHFHENNEYTRQEIRFFNAGASIKGNSNGETNVNFIEVNNDEIITETHRLYKNSALIIHRNIKLKEINSSNRNDKLKSVVNF